MAERSLDWMRQGEKDLTHAEHAVEDEDYEWASFAAQQSAEKAVKAVFQFLHGDVRGHSVSFMLGALPKDISVPDHVFAAAKSLDRHYIPARYPNGFATGAPMDYYTNRDAQEAITNARTIFEFCRGILRRQGEGTG